MKFIANEISVDAGIITVADVSYFKENRHSNLNELFDVPNGTYKVKWSIPDTWNGPISGESRLTVTSGQIIVSDPCYIISQDKWSAWLDENDYGCNIKGENAFSIDEMGGDGCYEVHLEFLKTF